MVVHRKTHDYPQGKPRPLLWLEIGMIAVALLFVLLIPGQWACVIAIVSVLIVVATISSKLHNHYERTGRAVRIPRSTTAVKFPKGMPRPMLAVRAGFFILAGTMLLLGVVPLKDSVARAGILACVLGLFGVGALNIGLEYYYLKRGDASQVELTER